MERKFMKKRMGKQMIAAATAAVMMCSPVVSSVHASDSLIDRAKAVNIVQGQNYAGELGENGAKDDTETYTFTLDSASEVNIDQNVRKKRNAYATLYNEDGNKVCRLTDSNMYLSAGTYYIVFTNLGSSPCEFSLAVSASTSHESFVDTISSGNDTLATASAIKLNTRYTGQVDITDENDWYKIVIPSDGKFGFSFTYDNKPTAYEPVEYEFTDDDGNAFTPGSTIKAGTYYLKVSYAGDYGSPYHFIVSYKASAKKVGKTSITSLSSGKTYFKVKFRKASNAQKYQISYSTSSKFKKAKTITTKSLSYTKKGLKKKTKYYVRVRGIRKEGKKTKYGSYSTAKSVRTKK